MTDGPADTHGAGPGIEETARLLGLYAAVEGRLYEVLGAWAVSEPVAELAVHFDALSQQHAWHASLFSEARPRLPDDEGPPSAPTAPAAPVLDALAGLPAGAERLSGLARMVLPRLVTGYRRHRLLARPLSDAAVVRALRLVVRDEVEAMVEVEGLLETLLETPEARRRAVGAIAALEELVATPGPGLVGGL